MYYNGIRAEELSKLYPTLDKNILLDLQQARRHPCVSAIANLLGKKKIEMVQIMTSSPRVPSTSVIHLDIKDNPCIKYLRNFQFLFSKEAAEFKKQRKIMQYPLGLHKTIIERWSNVRFPGNYKMIEGPGLHLPDMVTHFTERNENENNAPYIEDENETVFLDRTPIVASITMIEDSRSIGFCPEALLNDINLNGVAVVCVDFSI